MNVYIDANIWLGLYHFSKDNLNQFAKLKENKEIKIFIPQQTADEVRRNRMVKINDARKDFEKTKLNLNIPNLYREFEDQTEKYREFEDNFKQFFSCWKDEVSKAINDKSLKADIEIESLFTNAGIIDTSKYYEKAICRVNIGNPPGKNGSFGDAINWESLLKEVPDREDIYFITDDKDYFDDKENEIVNSFLKSEWESKKESKIYIFNSLKSFFDQHLKLIQLRENETKQSIIDSLSESGSFYSTHLLIEK